MRLQLLNMLFHYCWQPRQIPQAHASTKGEESGRSRETWELKSLAKSLGLLAAEILAIVADRAQGLKENESEWGFDPFLAVCKETQIER